MPDLVGPFLKIILKLLCVILVAVLLIKLLLDNNVITDVFGIHSGNEGWQDMTKRITETIMKHSQNITQSEDVKNIILTALNLPTLTSSIVLCVVSLILVILNLLCT